MKRTLLLDDDVDLCAVMVQFFESLGMKDFVSIHSYDQLVHLQDLNFDVALIDVNLGVDLPTGYDAYTYLMKKNFRGRIVFFSGHARSSPIIQKALLIPDVQFLEKPAELDEIERILL